MLPGPEWTPYSTRRQELVRYSMEPTLSTTLVDGTRKPRVKLPQLELPRFDGDIKQWPAFKNIFYASVDSVDLPLVSKLQYLKSALTGEAAGLISSLLII